MKLAAKVGGRPEDLDRVQSLRVELVTWSESAADAVVRDGDALHSVFVRRSLSGRCQCEHGARDGFCDHIAAAALTWMTRGQS